MGEVAGVTLIPGAAAVTHWENSEVALVIRLVAVADIYSPGVTEELNVTAKKYCRSRRYTRGRDAA